MNAQTQIFDERKHETGRMLDEAAWLHPAFIITIPMIPALCAFLYAMAHAVPGNIDQRHAAIALGIGVYVAIVGIVMTIRSATVAIIKARPE